MFTYSILEKAVELALGRVMRPTIGLGYFILTYDRIKHDGGGRLLRVAYSTFRGVTSVQILTGCFNGVISIDAYEMGSRIRRQQ
jgi:hypothetical protein